jgi:hypothetical protein
MAKHAKPRSMSIAPVRTVGITLVVAGLLAGQAAGQLVQDAITPSHDVRPTAQAVCYEDQPCWDSRYMGNQQAGVGAAHGPVMDEGGVYTCEPGGELVYDNGYGATVCDFSRRFI